MRTTIPLLTLLLLTLAPTMAFAHALGVAFKRDGGTVEIEAFYDDDSPAHQAKVQIVRMNDDVIAQGVTDKAGKWTFATPPAGKYEIRVDAGAGHRAKKTMTIAGPAAPLNTERIIPDQSAPREEQTQTPWLNVGVGLSVIALGSVALALGLTLFRGGNTRDTPHIH